MTPIPTKPTVHIMDPLRLKEEVADPAFQALLDQGYTVSTVVVLVDGRDDEERHRLAFVMAPPRVTGPVLTTLAALPGPVRWWAIAVFGLLISLTGIGFTLLVR